VQESLEKIHNKFKELAENCLSIFSKRLHKLYSAQIPIYAVMVHSELELELRTGHKKSRI